MKKANITIKLIISTALVVWLFGGCAGQKPQLNASQYSFEFNDTNYRIRSISSTDGNDSYNELIGENLVAIDFDQDRVIDRIALGKVSIADAQKIYDHGLAMVAQEKKLVLRMPTVHRYVLESDEFHFEIRSFRPPDAQPFNEFKIVDKRGVPCPEEVVVVDQGADGTLDELLKGTMTLENVQPKYTETIEAGLGKKQLVKSDGLILVKQ
jgi:hypothetical protein